MTTNGGDNKQRQQQQHTLIGYLQCEDRVTKRKGKKTATGYRSDLCAERQRLFLQQIGQSPNTN
jgi:hypothetical protein